MRDLHSSAFDVYYKARELNVAAWGESAKSTVVLPATWSLEIGANAAQDELSSETARVDSAYGFLAGGSGEQTEEECP